MDTVEIVLSVPALEHDRYVALLDDRARGFLQDDSELRVYVPEKEWSPALREQITAQLQADGYDDAIAVRVLRDRNWNDVWEQSIAPIRVGPFLLCGTSTDVPAEHGEAQILRIDPKMSFGTGHHATTRLALELLVETLDPNDRVLDVGTGTGVLAIAACRLGAQSVLAFDTEPNAVTNARENVATNDVGACVSVREGSIADAPPDAVDVILANITRDTLINMLPAFRSRLDVHGSLLLSGLLTSDRDEMLDALSAHDLRVEADATENGWWAVRACPRRSESNRDSN